MDEYVYHGTTIQGLKEIHPKESTHKHKWIYATKNKVVSAIFIKQKNTGGDFGLQKTYDPKTRKTIIIERYKNAFNNTYKGVSGSIYCLNRDDFEEKEDLWIAEVISKKTSKVLKEIKIDDISDYLNDFVKKGELKIYYYPDRPLYVPSDDYDLVELVALFWDKFGTDVSQSLKKFHQQLYEKHKDEILGILQKKV